MKNLNAFQTALQVVQFNFGFNEDAFNYMSNAYSVSDTLEEALDACRACRGGFYTGDSLFSWAVAAMNKMSEADPEIHSREVRAYTITREEIEQLRTEAGVAGDSLTVGFCDDALVWVAQPRSADHFILPRAVKAVLSQIEAARA